MLQSFLSYIQYEKRYSPHTLEAYRNDLEHMVQFLKAECNTETEQATHKHMRRWMVHLMDNEGCTTRTVNRKLSAARSYFRYLKQRQAITANPMLKVATPKTAKRLPVIVEEGAMQHLLKLLEDAGDFPTYRDKLIIELLYATGMRRAELLLLGLRDIDFGGGYIKVLGKGNKERLIPVGNEMLKSIEQYLSVREAWFDGREYVQDCLLLTNKGAPLYPKYIYNVVHQFLSAVTTLDKKSPHVLRHTFATHLLRHGADLNAIKELMGHANLTATQVYTNNEMETLKQVYRQAHPKA
jgi:integrase/recombinase XerC